MPPAHPRNCFQGSKFPAIIIRVAVISEAAIVSNVVIWSLPISVPMWICESVWSFFKLFCRWIVLVLFVARGYVWLMYVIEFSLLFYKPLVSAMLLICCHQLFCEVMPYNLTKSYAFNKHQHRKRFKFETCIDAINVIKLEIRQNQSSLDITECWLSSIFEIRQNKPWGAGCQSQWRMPRVDNKCKDHNWCRLYYIYMLMIFSMY